MCQFFNEIDNEERFILPANKYDSISTFQILRLADQFNLKDLSNFHKIFSVCFIEALPTDGDRLQEDQ